MTIKDILREWLDNMPDNIKLSNISAEKIQNYAECSVFSEISHIPVSQEIEVTIKLSGFIGDKVIAGIGRLKEANRLLKDGKYVEDGNEHKRQDKKSKELGVIEVKAIPDRCES